MTGDPLALIRRQQGGVLLDTNVLLLSLMMSVERQFIQQWKRTQQFSEGHQDTLELLLSSARTIVTTPHILTEATNLADKLPIHMRIKIMAAIAAFAQTAGERFKPSAKVSKDALFARLGLADVAQLMLPTRAKPVVITVDANCSSNSSSVAFLRSTSTTTHSECAELSASGTRAADR